MESNVTMAELKADARRFLIMSDIANGMGYMDILRKYHQEWGVGMKTVELIVKETIDFMRSETAKENLVSMNMQRLDSIITDTIKDDKKNAIKAIDVQNKLIGGYTEKVKIEGESEIILNFDSIG